MIFSYLTVKLKKEYIVKGDINMKLAIIGGGSTYTPHLTKNLLINREKLPFDTITLMDIDEKRLKIMTNFVKRMTEKHQVKDLRIEGTSDLEEAINDATIVLSTIRPGGNKLRAIDEKIAIKHGIIGQETTGPAGFAFALRAILPSIQIGKTIEKVAPKAWLINATNPAGIITEAIAKYTKAKVIGICHCGISLERKIAKHILSINDPQRVKIIYAGINHLGIILKVLLDGKEVPPEYMAKKLADFYAKQPLEDRLDPDFVLLWKWPFLVGLYWHYWFHTERMYKLQLKKRKVRGEEVEEIQEKLLKVLEKVSDWDEIPLELRARGSTELERKEMAEQALGGYIPGMIAVMNGLINNTKEILALNVQNNGSIEGIDDDAVVEVSGVITSSGFIPFRIGKLPLEIRGLIIAVKTYETLTVKAAVEGSYELALKALMANPLVRTYEKAKALLEDYLIADRKYLPQFEHVIKKLIEKRGTKVL